MTTTDKAAGLVARLLRYAGWTGEDCDCGSCVQCRNTDTMREAAATLETQASLINEAIEALERIKRKATPHPDDTDEDRRRCLFHVEANASTTLAKLRGQSS